MTDLDWDFVRKVRAGDLDRDGFVDLVVAGGRETHLLFGNGDGSYRPTLLSPPALERADAVELVDLDGDGLLDIVLGDYDGGVVTLRGLGDGSFEDAVAYPFSDRPTSIAVADVNGDGILDIAAARSTYAGDDSPNVRILLGDGDGSFAAQPPFTRLPTIQQIAVADLDGDGFPELLTLHTIGSEYLIVHPGVGNGTFGPGTAYATARVPLGIDVADIDGDAVPDVVVVGWWGGLALYRGRGDGSLEDPTVLPDHAGGSVQVVDLDADEIPDIVVGDSSVQVLSGLGGGAFEATDRLLAGWGAQGLAVVDVNDDGHLDFVTADQNAGTVTTLLGEGGLEYQAMRRMPTGATRLEDVAIGDLDGDGVPDLVASHSFRLSERGLAVYWGVDGVEFEEPEYILEGTRGELILEDLTYDGVLDVGVVDHGTLGVLRGMGDRSFGAPVYHPTGVPGDRTAVADLDGDSWLDVVVTGGETAVLYGAPGGDFLAPVPVPITGSGSEVDVADLDGDGVLDLVVLRYGDSSSPTGWSLALLRGQEDGDFQEIGSIPNGRDSYLALADLDHDGAIDIVTSDHGSSLRRPVVVYYGRGDGTFEEGFRGSPREGILNASFSGDRVVVEDFDRDGHMDVFVSSTRDSALLRGRGDRAFHDFVLAFTGYTDRSLDARDLDGDGLPDLVLGGGAFVVLAHNLGTPPRTVEIDVQPWHPIAWLRPDGRGSVLVAILGSEELDVAQIDRATLRLGAGEAQPIGASGGRIFDVDRDGFRDLLARYRIRDAGIAPGDTELCVVGLFADGEPFIGCDAIRTRSGCGLGFGAVLALTPALVPWRGLRRVRWPGSRRRSSTPARSPTLDGR